MRTAGFGPDKPPRSKLDENLIDATRKRLDRKLSEIKPLGLFEIERFGEEGGRPDIQIAASKLLLEIDREILKPEMERIFGPLAS